MGTGVQRRWVSLGLLAIIIPVGLVVGFRLTGFMAEPMTAPTETTTAETVYFRMERPNSYTVDPMEWVHNYYENNEISANFSVYVDRFLDHYVHGSDDVGMNITATASVPQGFIQSLFFTFVENYTNSVLEVEGSSPKSEYYRPLDYILKNLTVEDAAYRWDRWWMLRNNTKAYVTTLGVGRPDGAYFNTHITWVLLSPSNATHRMQIRLALTYWNGSTYKELIVPFELVLQPDSDRYQEAAVLTAGEYTGALDAWNDREDWFKIWLERNCKVRLGIAYSPLGENRTPRVDIHAYDSELFLKASSFYRPTAIRQFDFTADSTGWWYIQIKRHSDELNDHDYTHYAYILDISTSQTKAGASSM